MNFSNPTIPPPALPWLAWCLLAPVVAAYITSTPGGDRIPGYHPVLVLGAFFLVGVAAEFPMLTGPFPAPFSTVLALALPSVGGAAAAYVLALVVPGNINRVVHGILAFLIALAATIGVWLLIFLSTMRRMAPP